MAKLINFLSTTTEDFEKLNDSGIQYENSGYPNRIRLREESHANIIENLASMVTVSETKESDSSFLFTEVGEHFEQSAPSKAIRLNSEKTDNLLTNLGIDIDKTSEITIEETAVDEKVEVEQNVEEKDEQEVSEISTNNENQEPIEETTEIKQETVGELANSIEVYQLLQKETEEALEAKKTVAKLKIDVEEAEKSTSQQIEESEQKVLGKSAELAEAQARKAAAIARRKEVIAMSKAQLPVVTKAKQKDIDEQHTLTLKLQELQDYAQKCTKANEEKLVEFQRQIDKELSDSIQIENETAQIEAMFAASNLSYFGNDENNESYQKKVA